jgi:hypothetical protein
MQGFVLAMLEYIGLVIYRVADKLGVDRPLSHPEYRFLQNIRT